MSTINRRATVLTDSHMASGYDNEEDVGAAIRESGRARENIFVVTKNSGGHSREETIQALDDSLERLGLDFVDLYLVQ